MKFKILFLLLIIISITDLIPCTIFKTTYEGQTLVGNNEDWIDKDKKVWFLKAEEGKYGRVFFGFKNGWAQGGMNDQGLFFDWIAGFKEEWKSDPKRMNFYENISEKILEEAATLEEALKYFYKYNVEFFSMSRIMLVDKEGNAAIVRYSNGRLNIDLIKLDSYAVGLYKKKANRMLNRKKDHYVKDVKKILKSCLHRGRFATKYSNIYDLQKGNVYISDFKKTKKSFKFNLVEELKKGNHYYDISKLGEQINKPPMIDTKTMTPKKIDKTEIDKMTGEFSGVSNRMKNLKIIKEDKNLYFLPIKGDKRRYTLYPSSNKSLFIRSIDCHFNFYDKNKNGKYNKILMKRSNKEYILTRI